VFKRSQKNFVYLLIILVPFFFLFLRPTLFTPLKQNVIQFSAFPLKIIHVIGLEIKKVFYYRMAYDEYLKIKRDNDALRAHVMGFDQVIQENARLSQLLDFKRTEVYASSAAHVVGRDPTYWNSSLIIDKGAANGIRQGMPVVHSSGIIGKVAEVYKYSSKVIILTDPQFSVAAVLQESRESGLVTGTLEQNTCRMRYINENTPLKVGEEVVTSKISSSFPENLLIGRVVRIQKNPNSPSLEAIIKPAAKLSQLEEVLVIIK
jgi:rod shape-determining protein MreC